ncbi:MAG: tetratricopeptide repeat protein [Deltaproteobacteria bacterium]|nr:tetratricopeptide repeat protein [Deltaproteobacteria bacterium]MBW2072527.1 tetratricopeptide repeat protein [Deltaproteobacteria bacterium]
MCFDVVLKWRVLLAVSGIIVFVLLSGCHSLPQPQSTPPAEERWVCPEFADLPMRQDRMAEAISNHLKVLASDPDNALAYYHLGYCWGRIGDHQEEVVAYLRAVDLGLQREDLYYNLGMAWAELGAYDRAEQALEKAVAMAPDNGENHRALGMVYFRQHYFAEAVEACRRATELEPAAPESWHCLALSLAAAGEVEQARRALERLLQLEGNYPLEKALRDLRTPAGERH